MIINTANLDEFAQGVPRPVRPLYWDRRLPVAANVNMLHEQARQMSQMTPGRFAIDECSVLLPNEALRERFDVELALAGWEQFNSASDLVFTNPFGTRYVVEYYFYRHARVPWRLEVMKMGRALSDQNTGFSPLHAALWHPNGGAPFDADWAELPVPHFSYKVPRIEGRTARQSYAKEINWLGKYGTGMVHAMTCQSTYGVFSYWLHQDATRQTYLKPRANLRDEDAA